MKHWSQPDPEENNGPLFNERIKNDARTYRESSRNTSGGDVVEVVSSGPANPAQKDSGTPGEGAGWGA